MSLLKFMLLVLFAAMLLPRIYKLLKFMDFGESVVNHTPGPCHQVKGLESGSEDMDMIPGTDIALISTGLKYGTQTGMPNRQGNIAYFNFAKPQDGAKPVKFNGFKNFDSFNPHGISIVEVNGKTYLFVVNHANDTTSVERFQVDVKSYTLTHLESVTHEDFRYINDISAVNERAFYFTNYMHYNPGTVLGTIENFAMLRFAELCYFDGEKNTVLEGNLLLPNGINQSPDRKHLYVAVVGDSQFAINTYEIMQAGKVKLVQQKEIDSNGDNIMVDPKTGDLWLGCHPIGWKVVHYVDHQATAISPSQVLRVKTKNGLLTNDIIEVFMDTGDMISASSVAVYHKSSLLIGSISHKAVYCEVKNIK